MSESERRPSAKDASASTWQGRILKALLGLVATAGATALAVLMLVAIALAVAYPNLPDIHGITDYQPKLPLRIFSSDGVLIGEFGEERRNFVPIAEMPQVMRDAVLAAEDARFYEHGGIDYKGVLRAGMANFSGLGSQGASTITMQVAKNFYLSTEKTLTRKIYERAAQDGALVGCLRRDDRAGDGGAAGPIARGLVLSAAQQDVAALRALDAGEKTAVRRMQRNGDAGVGAIADKRRR